MRKNAKQTQSKCKCASEIQKRLDKSEEQRAHLVKVNQELLKEKDDLHRFLGENQDKLRELTEINEGQETHIENYKNTLGEMMEERSKLERDASSFKTVQMIIAASVGFVLGMVVALMFF